MYDNTMILHLVGFVLPRINILDTKLIHFNNYECSLVESLTNIKKIKINKDIHSVKIINYIFKHLILKNKTLDEFYYYIFDDEMNEDDISKTITYIYDYIVILMYKLVSKMIEDNKNIKDDIYWDMIINKI
jgi:hypothetical protein